LDATLGTVCVLVVVPAKLRVRIVPGWCVTAETVVAGRSIVAPTALLIGGAKELTQLVVDLV